MNPYVCLSCKYFNTCGDCNRTEECKGKTFCSFEQYTERETRDKGIAYEAFRDLKGSLYQGNVNHGSSCIVSDSWIADCLGITEDEATEIRMKIVYYGFSERQGGGLVL